MRGRRVSSRQRTGRFKVHCRSSLAYITHLTLSRSSRLVCVCTWVDRWALRCESSRCEAASEPTMSNQSTSTMYTSRNKFSDLLMSGNNSTDHKSTALAPANLAYAENGRKPIDLFRCMCWTSWKIVRCNITIIWIIFVNTKHISICWRRVKKSPAYAKLLVTRERC